LSTGFLRFARKTPRVRLYHGRLADLDRHVSGTTGEEGPWARLERLQGEGRALDRILQITASGSQARDDTTAQVIAGRLALRQAAARFRAADAGLPPERIRAKLDRFAVTRTTSVPAGGSLPPSRTNFGTPIAGRPQPASAAWSVIPSTCLAGPAAENLGFLSGQSSQIVRVRDRFKSGS
jgi:hypothetical protein